MENRPYSNGSKKSWRKTPSCNKASFLVDHNGHRTRIEPLNDHCLPGNLVWFGTARDEGNIYGPCRFEFNYSLVLQAYQVTRSDQQKFYYNDQKICYRAGGTLVYQKEVSHIVIVCCTTDECYKDFPLIEDDRATKFFTVSSKSDFPSILINEYPPYDRHEHVIFAFYLPDHMSLKLPNKIGFSELKRIDHGFCVKSKGNCNRVAGSTDIDEGIRSRWDRWSSS